MRLNKFCENLRTFIKEYKALEFCLFIMFQCNGNNVEVKQSSIIRDFHVPKYVIEGETVELHCGVTRDGWSILDSLRWYKV